MTESQWITRILKPLIWAAAAGPAVWLVWCFLRMDLGVDPVRTITHTTGLSALIILFCTLAVTPLRRWTGLNALIKVRRLVGLWAFTYALLHFLTYAIFDRMLSPAGLWEDIVKRPWVTVGFTAFLILCALAATSPKAMVRKLGGKRWQALHRLIYVAAALGVFHFLWLVKADTREPTIYALILVALLLTRSTWLLTLARLLKWRPKDRSAKTGTDRTKVVPR